MPPNKFTITVSPAQPGYDSRAVLINGPVHRGLGYQSIKDPTEYGLARCPDCGAENYGPNVASGTCYKCGWDIKEHINSINPT